MKKFNWMDMVIVLLIIVVAAGGYWYLNRKDNAISAQSSKIEFTVEVSGVPLEVANVYHIGDKATFGTKNVDTGVISNVVVTPHTQDLPNVVTGEMQQVAIEGLYNANVTIQTQGRVTELAIQSAQEVLNVGVDMIFHGKGFAGKGFIIGLHALKESE